MYRTSCPFASGSALAVAVPNASAAPATIAAAPATAPTLLVVFRMPITSPDATGSLQPMVRHRPDPAGARVYPVNSRRTPIEQQVNLFVT